MKESVLVIFSNPADSTRLRLDRESRILDEVCTRADARGSVKILHAATIADLIVALSAPSLRVVHFSGHGSPESIYLEVSGNSDKGMELGAEHLAELVRGNCRHIQALILLSCYSAASSKHLNCAAPYVITVEGPADDTSALTFTRYFYSEYFRTGSVESALTHAQISMRSLGHADGLQIFVTRRGEEISKDRTLIRAIKHQGRQDTLLIDVTEVEVDLENLDIPKSQFLSLLSNKMGIHRWLIFETTDMEHAVLPIGRYFGMFSWKNGMDVIVCRKIIRPKKDANEDHCEMWMSLCFGYNVLFGLRYRRAEEAVFPEISRKLEVALNKYENIINRFFQDKKHLAMMREVIGEQLKLSLPLILENFREAKEEFFNEEYAKVTIYLETTLSLIHGILDGLVGALTQ